MTDPLTDVTEYFNRSRDTLARAATDRALLESIVAIAEATAQSLRAGGKILLAGNGGSAADAQHIAAEMLSRFKFNRAPLPAIALTTDTSVLTAIGNDFGFDQVFERQVQGLGRKGDCLIAISTSGRSPNILKALQAAREMGIVNIAFTGAPDNAMKPLCDLVLAAPSDETALIQQVHITAAHAICDLVERNLFPAR